MVAGGRLPSLSSSSDRNCHGRGREEHPETSAASRSTACRSSAWPASSTSSAAWRSSSSCCRGLWWDRSRLPAALAYRQPRAGAVILLVLVRLAAAIGLVVLGAATARAGAAGTASGRASSSASSALLVILLLTRWASLWLRALGLRQAAYQRDVRHRPDRGLIGLASCWLLVRALIFLRPGFEAEPDAAWRTRAGSATSSYKRSQGMRVRRGTIVGILAPGRLRHLHPVDHSTLAGAGDWNVGVPFTGVAEVTALNDARELYPPALRPIETVTLQLERQRHRGLAGRTAPQGQPAGSRASRPHCD